MRIKNTLAALLLVTAIASVTYAGVMDSPPVAPPDPEPTPTQSMTAAAPSDTSTAPDAPETSDLVTTIVTTLIPLMF